MKLYITFIFFLITLLNANDKFILGQVQEVYFENKLIYNKKEYYKMIVPIENIIDENTIYLTPEDFEPDFDKTDNRYIYPFFYEVNRNGDKVTRVFINNNEKLKLKVKVKSIKNLANKNKINSNRLNNKIIFFKDEVESESIEYYFRYNVTSKTKKFGKIEEKILNKYDTSFKKDLLHINEQNKLSSFNKSILREIKYQYDDFISPIYNEYYITSQLNSVYNSINIIYDHFHITSKNNGYLVNTFSFKIKVNKTILDFLDNLFRVKNHNLFNKKIKITDSMYAYDYIYFILLHIDEEQLSYLLKNKYKNQINQILLKKNNFNEVELITNLERLNNYLLKMMKNI